MLRFGTAGIATTDGLIQIRSTVEVWEQFLESPDSAKGNVLQDAAQDLVATRELYEPINQALTGFVMRVDL